MKHISATLFTVLILGLNGFAQSVTLPPLEVVPQVDLNRYIGKWYEIASFPQFFTANCVASTAEYSLLANGDVKVDNKCHDKTINGPIRSVMGRAWVVDKTTNAKLNVQFFWPFWGRYWVIDLGKNYEYAVVGHPNRDFLWILSRTPQMDTATFQKILDRLKLQHYNIEKLIKNPQPLI